MQEGKGHRSKTNRMAMGFIAVLLLIILIFTVLPWQASHNEEMRMNEWQAPDSARIPGTPDGDLIRYGRELVANTSVYLGPRGKVAHISNGMNCQNCHLKAGKKLWGNNFSAVASTYPKFRGRSGTLEGIEKRVNDCLQRSLNGQPLNNQSLEMKAFVAYIKWVGSEVSQGTVPEGAGIINLPPLERAADPKKGEAVFAATCARCHGASGEGMKPFDGTEWVYPPLWGEGSFNTGAGILRLSRMAGFIQKNMPGDVPETGVKLSDEEAWDVAAFICSQPRPQMDLTGDWPDISQKPFDYPFGPYADTFSEEQHKYGPFLPIRLNASKH